MNIQYSGINDLNEQEKAIVQQIAGQEIEKFSKFMPELQNAILHIKAKDKPKKRYTVHFRLLLPAKVLESCECEEFDIKTAMHKAVEDIEKQVEHHRRN